MPDFITQMDKPLLQLTSKDSFSARDSFCGVHIYGAIGSGKTSGSGKAIAGAYLRAGYGGLVLCAKPEEVELWLDYCKQHGRANSIVLFDKSRHFNFLSYEFAKKGAEGANSATDLLMKILKASDRAAGQGGGREGDAIWIKTTREMILNTVSVLFSATGNVRIEDIVNFVTSMPTTQPKTPEETQKTTRNFAMVRMTKMLKNPAHPLPKHSTQRLCNYWFSQFPKTPEKMRGSIMACVTAELNRFTDGILRECFTTTTDLVPEMVFSGAIIIMAFPKLTYQEEGEVAQQLFKLMFQRAVENRNSLPPVFRERPLFLWADEAQFFVSEADDQFLSTCRGSKCAVVYLTQSLPTYYAQLGKDKSDAVDGFVGKFVHKIFHSTADPRTANYASTLIGRKLHLRRNSGESKGTTSGSSKTSGRSTTDSYSYGGGQNQSGSGLNANGSSSVNSNASGGSGSNSGYSVSEGESFNSTLSHNEVMDVAIEPNFFSQCLLTGAAPCNYTVTGLWVKAGGTFKKPLPDTTSNVILATFKQK